jgi:hypothetical protein
MDFLASIRTSAIYQSAQAPHPDFHRCGKEPSEKAKGNEGNEFEFPFELVRKIIAT